MDLILSTEQQMLADTARAFAEREGATPFTRDRWRAMASLGWTDLGDELFELALVCESLGRGPVASPLVVTSALAACGALDAVGRLTADGAVIATLAHVEGDDGTMILVPWADAADVIVVAGADGLVAVDGAMSGVVRHDDFGADPLFAVEWRGRATTPVPGPLSRVVDVAATLQLAFVVGAAERALDLALDHARTRHQFGRPIGSFQAVAHRCVDMRADIDACRQLAYRAAWALARRDGAELEVASAKAYANDAMRRIFANAHQVMGAVGFSTEHDLHRFTRYAKSFELTYGTTGDHLDRVATAMGLHR